MHTPLLPTQIDDVDQIAARTDLPNFSEPGTGKTITTLGAVSKLRLQSGLVVCPTVATLMWQENIERELGAKTQWLKTRATKIDKTADFLIASYGVLGDHQHTLMDRKNGALIVDESQYVKSSDAQRTAALFGVLGDGIGGLYETSEQCWCLSGEPVERYADDLWSQLRATQPGWLDSYGALSLADFQAQFCRMEWKEYAGGAVRKFVSVANQSTRLLNRMLYTDIGAIRRTIRDVDPYMPEVTLRNVFTRAKVTPELKSLLVGKTEGEIMDLILEGGDKITRARRLMGMAKLKEVTNYIKEQSRSGKPILVGFWHNDVGAELYKSLTGSSFAANLIYGGTSTMARDRIKHKFINGEIDILLGQIQAMGVAMDGLQGVCDHVIFAEMDWSGSKMSQFYKRVARKGQTKRVQVDFCTSLEAVDTALEKIRQRKDEGAQAIHSGL